MENANAKELFQEQLILPEYMKKEVTQKDHLKKLNNEEFLANLMLFSPYGALCQVFLIEAIRYYAERVAATDPTPNDKAAIDPVVWQGIAKDVSEKIKLKYE